MVGWLALTYDLRPIRYRVGQYGLIAIVVVVIWMATGIFIVQEGQQAVITRFGRYSATVGAGFNWRLPYPIERHEIVNVTQIRAVDVGRDTVITTAGGLRLGIFTLTFLDSPRDWAKRRTRSGLRVRTWNAIASRYSATSRS